MSYIDEELQDIFDMTGGTCYYCGGLLVYWNYGSRSAMGGWCVDHGNPLSRYGVDDLRNWKPSCYPCDEEKHGKTTSEYGRRARRLSMFP
ncbi:hypothetical protein ACFLVF_00065 [Chloroflexota bacterium]